MSDEAIRVPLRWRDLDNQNHVYHAEYLTLLDQARTAWLHACLGIDSADEYIIARVEIDYVSEIFISSSSLRSVGSPAVDVTFEISRLGTKSITTQEVMSTLDGVCVARAVTVLLLWDRSTRQTRELTTIERDIAKTLLAVKETET